MMKNSYLRRRKVRKRVIVLVTFLVLTTVFSCIGRNICHAREQERRANAHEFAAGELRKIAYAIESRITTAKALERYVQSRDGVIDDFAEVAQFYFVDDPALRSIQLAPGGIVTQDLMYPQEDGLLRHDLFADPIRKHEAEQARDTGKVVLAGPYALYQGGQGLIVRDPVYLTDENGESYFWGFSTVIFNVPEVFDLEKMNLLSGDDYVHRLWRYGWLDGETIVMVESTADPLPDAIREQVEICDELWYLDIEPADGWLPLGLVLRVALTGATALVLIMVGLVLHLRARDMMYYDRLLDIGNMNALAAAYRHAPAETLDRMFAVVLDIDRFKEFNYIYGTDEGNHLLRYIADALQEEAPNASVFRYAFDYFILMEVFDDLESCERRVQQILGRFKRDIIAGTVPTFEISAGIRKVAADEPLQVVIDDALIARESVKGNVLQHYAVYDEVTRGDRLTNMALRSDLPGAIENKEIKIYYQPKYNMITGEIIGCEALSRWVRPDGTMIGPDVFIPCFEESHQITLLDEYVLTEVCRQMRSMIADRLPVRVVSVNLSRVHLRESGLLPKLEEIIRAHDIDPAMLSFEITESALYEDAIPLRSIVEHLHSLGCRVAMDDYGVGVSGPKSLTSYRFDTVKLDKSFVDDLYNPKVADLVRSTSYLVKKWGMRVVAEGVETKEQTRKLVGLGCVYAQGFYYAKPMPEQEYRTLLRDSVDSYGIEERQMRLQPQFFSDDVCAVFDSNPLPVYIINPRSFTVVYCNLALQNALGEDVTGGVCYKKLNGKEHVCRNCVAMRLYRDGDGSPIEYMSRTGVWRRVQASPLHWRGQDYIRVSSMDITRQKRLEEQIRSLAEGEQQA